MSKSTTISACAIVVLAGTSVGAQVIDWIAPIDGNWNNSANWMGANVPNAIGEDAVLGLAGAYTVSQTDSFTIGSLTLTNPLAALEIGNSRTLTLNGNLTNDGTITVNFPSTIFNTHLSFGADAAISGSGSIRLIAQNEPGDAQILANAYTITHALGHTIHGSGRISGNLLNSGSIIADDPGGAGLLLAGTTTQDATGTILADAGTVILGGGSVTTGGTITTLNGGVVDSQNNAVIGDITNNGQMNIPGQGWLLLLNNTITNNGDVLINSNDNIFNAHIRFDADATLDGTGTISMVSLGDLADAQLFTLTGITGTIGTDQTVQGSGLVDGRSGGTIVNTGTISANDPAVGLGLAGNHDGSGGGIYRSDDGTLVLRDGLSLDGGTFDSTGVGIADMTTSGTATLSNVTNLGEIGIRGQGGIISLIGPMTNDGTLTVNSNTNIFNAHLRFDASTTINGSGTVRMLSAGDLADAQLFTNGVFNATIGPDQTIAGAGLVDGRSGGTIVNTGTINGDHAAVGKNPAIELRLQGSHDGSGGGVYRSDDGILGLSSGLVLDGGTFDSSGVGIVDMTTSGVATLSNVTNLGAMGIRGKGGVVALDGPLTNNGLIKINSNDNIFNAHIRFAAETIIDGTGTIDMLVTSDFGDAQILNDQGFVGTIGNGQTITGNGRLQGEMNMDGTLDPGSTFRRFEIDTLHLSPSSGFIADLGGTLAGEYDRLLLGGSDTINLDGTLTVNLDSGYVPVFGDTWDIVSGGTINGMFTAENVPTAGLGQVYRVIYQSNRVYVILTCDADLNGDNTLDFFDVSAFLGFFSAEDVRGDLTGDGQFNFFDISLFLQLFSGGCAG